VYREYSRLTFTPVAQGGLGAPRIDIYDKRYVGRIFFYVFCGLLDAMWQTTAYWLMGAMSNDPAKLAFFTGYCQSLLFIASRCVFINPLDKSIQSAGAAGMWRADAVKTP
jgi:hypothetical protein